VRWCGNEEGKAGDPNWSMVNPSIVTFPGATGPLIGDALLHGAPNGTVWRPAEADVSIRPGWFHHDAEDARVRSVDNLVDLYFSSVGRNSKLLLNVPPTSAGLLHDTDVARLAGTHARLGSMFEHDLATGAHTQWRTTGPRSAQLEIELKRGARADTIRLAEDITHGQAVARYSVQVQDGSRTGSSPWPTITRDTTIGYARLDRFPLCDVSRLRVTIEDAVSTPRPLNARLYESPRL
jgi:alpha-L-fucosidase